MADIPRLNGAIRALEQGKPAFTAFAAPEINTAQALGAAAYDGVVFEMEHNPYDIKQLRDCMQYMLDRKQILKSGSLAPAVAPFVRIPPNGAEMSQWMAKQVLDIGVYGVVWPHVSTVEEARNAVAAYATVGLPAYSETELVAACKTALVAGFHGVKILVGGARLLAEDAKRIRAVRDAIGAAPLMLDANCAYSLADAKRLAAQVADCDIAFFEEPLRGNDIAALVELRRATSIPVASGQMIQSMKWFRDALVAGALDVVQPNAAFCGGISAMLRVLALAEAHGVPVAGAGGFEAANLPAMAGHAHGGILEVHGAHAALRTRFATEPEFREGQLLVPAAPGLGFSLHD